MKNIMKQTLLVLALCLFILSCKKNSSKGIDNDWPCDIWEDSASISSQIVGSWIWTKYYCSNDFIMADKNIKLTVNLNGSYILQENSSTLAQGTWKLKNVYIAGWAFDLTAPSDYLKGYLDFCNNQVAFVDSYENQCNYFFKKVK